MARPASAITLREVVEAVEGPIVPNRCLLGSSCDRGGPCLVHGIWKTVQTEVVRILEDVTIETLARTRGE